MYFSGQGKVLVAALIAGVPQTFRWVGNVPDFAPKFETTKKEHKEAWSGQRLTDSNLPTENKSSFSATLEDWSKQNLAMVTRGTAGVTTAGNVENEASPAGLAVGDIWALKNPKVSAVVVKDSAGVPAVVDPSKYTLDADFGTIVLNDATGLTLPLTASYTKGVVDLVTFFTEGVTEVAVRFEGVNTADGNKKVLCELYKVALDPTQELGLITEEYGKFVMGGNVLADSTKSADPLMGQFGRLVYLEA